MLLSEQITKLIEEMLKDGNGTADVKRNDLAQSLGCVPSQISYVISSRFTPERGYMTESRRGGGGYIRIVRVPMTKNSYLTHFFHSLPGAITAIEAKAYTKNMFESGLITAREARLIISATSNTSLEKIVPKEGQEIVRADIMRQLLMTLISE